MIDHAGGCKTDCNLQGRQAGTWIHVGCAGIISILYTHLYCRQDMAGLGLGAVASSCCPFLPSPVWSMLVGFARFIRFLFDGWYIYKYISYTIAT